MGRFTIATRPENCAGCLRCQLACAYVFNKIFDPSLARIKIDTGAADFSITFTKECDNCAVCVEHCFYGALEKVAGGV
jgi:Fe-S-cluster-containing hydrogenase component 2